MPKYMNRYHEDPPHQDLQQQQPLNANVSRFSGRILEHETNNRYNNFLQNEKLKEENIPRRSGRFDSYCTDLGTPFNTSSERSPYSREISNSQGKPYRKNMLPEFIPFNPGHNIFETSDKHSNAFNNRSSNSANSVTSHRSSQQINGVINLPRYGSRIGA